MLEVRNIETLLYEIKTFDKLPSVLTIKTSWVPTEPVPLRKEIRKLKKVIVYWLFAMHNKVLEKDMS